MKCLLRIKNRDRKGENIIKEYINNCHLYHIKKIG